MTHYRTESILNSSSIAFVRFLLVSTKRLYLHRHRTAEKSRTSLERALAYTDSHIEDPRISILQNSTALPRRTSLGLRLAESSSSIAVSQLGMSSGRTAQGSHNTASNRGVDYTRQHVWRLRGTRGSARNLSALLLSILSNPQVISLQVQSSSVGLRPYSQTARDPLTSSH